MYKTLQYMLVTTFFALAMSQRIPFDQPLPCMTSPVPEIEAGSDLIFQ